MPCMCTMAFCHVAKRARRRQVGNSSSRSFRKNVIGDGNERIFFHKHFSVFHDNCKPVHVRIDYKSYVCTSGFHQIGNLRQVLRNRLRVCANCPVGAQFNSTTFFSPNAFKSFGMTMPPTELTASTATVKFAFRMASTSTKSSASTLSMCRRVYVSFLYSCPKLSTSANVKASFSAIASTSLPSASLKKIRLSHSIVLKHSIVSDCGMPSK